MPTTTIHKSNIRCICISSEISTCLFGELALIFSIRKRSDARHCFIDDLFKILQSCDSTIRSFLGFKKKMFTMAKEYTSVLREDATELIELITPTAQ